MRILHLGKYYPPAPGGIESHLETLASIQSDLGHEVHVVCVNHVDKRGNSAIHTWWRRTSLEVHFGKNIRVERAGRWFAISRLDFCPSLMPIIRMASRHVDVIHMHTPNPLMLFAWRLSGNKKVPLVITHHSDVIKQKKLQKIVQPLESNVYKNAKLILSDSPNYISGSEILNRYPAKTRVLPLGINLGKYENPSEIVQKKSISIRNKYQGPLWLMVGRMTYYKGYSVALEALAQVDGTLIIVGTGELEKELKAMASRLGVLDRIVWNPSLTQEDLIALYHSATALWFPSIARSEGFGLVQVEAMASGCPVINTNIPASGVSWVSLNDVSGLTVPVGDAREFADACRKIAASKELRERLSAGAKTRARNLFDSQKMAETSLSLYAEAIG